MWNLVFSVLSLFSASTPQEMAFPEATMVFVGDAMQHQNQIDVAKEIGKGDYDYSDCFTLIAPAIKEADYAICNLEVPLAGGPNYTGFPCFNAPDSYAQALEDAGFDMMLTANNHCLDRKDAGARRTLDMLDKMEVDHIGTYRTAAERDSLVPFIKNIKGYDVAFLNYTYGTNGIKPVDGMEVALIDKEKMKKEVELARQKGAELVVVAIHWGIEYVLIENEVQRKLADFLVNDCGVDMIIGGHPHVIQPMKVVRNEKEDKDVLVVYSLGNFISNMKTADTRGGAMVWVTIGRDENGKARFKNAEYDTFFSAKPEKNRNHRVIPSWLSDSIPASQKAHWELFQRGALNIFDKHNVNVPRKTAVKSEK